MQPESLNLFGEAEPYGPKEQPLHDTRPRNTNGPKNANADSVSVLGHWPTRTTNPAGAPPLDWWVIDDAVPSTG